MTKTSAKSNFIYNALYQLSSIIIPLVTLPYLTRILHAKGMGEYSFAYSVAYYFYLFIRLGLHNYGTRTIAFNKDDKQLLSKSFCEIYSFQIVMCLFMMVLYFFYCLLWAPNKTLATIFVLLVLAGGIDVTWALYGLEEFKITSIRDMVVKISTAFLIFSFVKNENDVWIYSLIYVIGFFVSQLVSLPILFREVIIIRPTIGGVKSHIKPNLILFLPTIAVSIYKTMDKIMLGTLANDVELGYYHSSENIIAVPLALITALGTVMLPRMSNMLSAGGKRKEVDILFDKSISFAMFVSTSICMGIMTVSKEFVPIFFGPGFEKCVFIFDIILPSCIFLAFANVIRTQYLLPRKRDGLFIVSLFSGAVVNLVLNYLLIPHLASVGAAIGTLAAEVVVCVIQAAFVYKEANIGRNILNSLPFIIAGIAMFSLFRDYTVGITSNAIAALVIKIGISGLFYLVIIGVLWSLKKGVKAILACEYVKSEKKSR